MSEKNLPIAVDNNIYSVEKTKVNSAILAVGKKYFGETIDSDKTSLPGFLVEMLGQITEGMSVKENLREDERYISTARLTNSLEKLGAPYNYEKLVARPTRIIVELTITMLPADTLNNAHSMVIPSETVIFYLGKPFSLIGEIVLARDPATLNFHAKYTNNINDSRTPIVDIPVFTGKNENDQDVSILSIDLLQVSTRVIKHIVLNRSRLVFYKFEIPKLGQLSSIIITLNDGGTVVVERVNNSFKGSILVDDDTYTFLLHERDDRYIIWLDTDQNTKYIKPGVELNIRLNETEGDIGTSKNSEVLFETPADFLPRVFSAGRPISALRGSDENTFEQYRRSLIAHIQTPNFKNPITTFDYENMIEKIFGIDVDTKIVVRTLDSAGLQVDTFMTLTDGELIAENVLTNSLDYIIPPSEMVAGKIFADLSSVFLLEKNLVGHEDNYTATKHSIVDFLDGTGITLRDGITQLLPGDINTDNDKKVYQSFITHKFFDNPKRTEAFSPAVGIKYHRITVNAASPNQVDMFPVAFKTETRLKKTPAGEFVLYGKITVNYDVMDKPVHTLTPGAYSMNIILDGQVFTAAIDNSALTAVLELPAIRVKDLSLTDTVILTLLDGTFADANMTSVVTLQSTGPNNTSTYDVLDNYTLFFNDSDILSSSSKTKSSITTGVSYDVIKKLPMINVQEYINFTDSSYKHDTVDLYTIYMAQMRSYADTINKVTSAPNTNRIKFFNTSGFEARFNDYTTNTDLHFVVEVSFHYNKYSIDIFDQIKTTIVEYVTKTQLEGSTDRGIYISRLTQLLENGIDPIHYINIVSPSGNLFFDERWNDTRLLSKQEMEDFVPTKINVKRENIRILVK